MLKVGFIPRASLQRNQTAHGSVTRTGGQISSVSCLLFPVFGLLALAPLFAQQPLFRAGIDLVHVGVTVLDRKGETVTDLTADDFEVYEDGRRQDVRYFSLGLESDLESMPLHVGVLFDASGSMDLDADFAKTAAIKFLNSLAYAADMTLVDFDTQVRVTRFGARDFPRLVERIRNRKVDGWTAMYDAVGVYLDGASDQSGRKVVLLYTDGADTRSRIAFGEIIDLLKASDVTVYAIGFQKSLPVEYRMRERMRLEQLVQVTGGRCYFPDSKEDLDAIYDQILSELNARYSLGYISTNTQTDGRWRRVEIKISDDRPDRKGLKVRTREGYFAPYYESQTAR
jgi:Ca-activated chloride channel family protein